MAGSRGGRKTEKANVEQKASKVGRHWTACVCVCVPVCAVEMTAIIIVIIAC